MPTAKNRLLHCAPSFRYLAPDLKVLEEQFTANENLLYAKRNVIKKMQLGSQAVVVKSFKPPGLIRALIYANVQKSKALRSYENALKLQQLGILTPEPIAVIEYTRGYRLTESYYITRHYPHEYTMEAVLKKAAASDQSMECSEQSQSMAIVEAFVQFTFNMHQANVLHCDHNPNNTLIGEKDGAFEFAIIDLNRMRFKKLSLVQRLNEFVRLSDDPFVLSKISTTYAQCLGLPANGCHDILMKLMRRRGRIRRAKQFFKKIMGP